MNCMTCEHALKRSYSEGGLDIVCSIDVRQMGRYLNNLTECSKYREIGKEGKDTKEKGRRP
jgi:hypothetical protein